MLDLIRYCIRWGSYSIAMLKTMTNVPARAPCKVYYSPVMFIMIYTSNSWFSNILRQLTILESLISSVECKRVASAFWWFFRRSVFLLYNKMCIGNNFNLILSDWKVIGSYLKPLTRLLKSLQEWIINKCQCHKCKPQFPVNARGSQVPLMTFLQ